MNKSVDEIMCGHLSDVAQQNLLADIRGVLQVSPLFQPLLPRWGTPFSVLMSNCGPLGWVSDKSGYRYQAFHPDTDEAWPAMPPSFIDIWQRFAKYEALPQAALINYYRTSAKMGLHQDKDEKDFEAPVISISLGNTARFKLGGLERKGPTQNFDLKSGDVMRLAGKNRLAFHGVDKIYPNTSVLLAPYGDLFPDDGRINITLRRVNKPK